MTRPPARADIAGMSFLVTVAIFWVVAVAVFTCALAIIDRLI